MHPTQPMRRLLAAPFVKNKGSANHNTRPMQRAATAFLLLLGMAAASTHPALAAATPAVSLLPYDLVDASLHCDYDLRATKYSHLVAKAAAVWNAYKPGVLRASTPAAPADVLVQDYFRPATNGSIMAGYTVFPTGIVMLNSAFFDDKQFSPALKLKVLVHELGHCLGLDENNSGDPHSVMRQGPYENLALCPQDQSAYDAAALRY